jgi:hypothetical protein
LVRADGKNTLALFSSAIILQGAVRCYRQGINKQVVENVFSSGCAKAPSPLSHKSDGCASTTGQAPEKPTAKKLQNSTKGLSAGADT